MVIYAPGTEETDPKKQNMALQEIAGKTDTAITDIETNTTDIATNTANIATNTANIATNTTNIATNTTDIATNAAAIAALIPAGTIMLFQQTSAPTGWTKGTTHNDKALRIVSGTASSGGTNSFSTVMAQTTVGSHTLTTAEIPAHTHTYNAPIFTFNAAAGGSAVSPGTASDDTGSTGGGGSHNHTITMAMQYVDVIVASKN